MSTQIPLITGDSVTLRQEILQVADRDFLRYLIGNDTLRTRQIMNKLREIFKNSRRYWSITIIIPMLVIGTTAAVCILQHQQTCILVPKFLLFSCVSVFPSEKVVVAVFPSFLCFRMFSRYFWCCATRGN